MSPAAAMTGAAVSPTAGAEPEGSHADALARSTDRESRRRSMRASPSSSRLVRGDQYDSGRRLGRIARSGLRVDDPVKPGGKIRVERRGDLDAPVAPLVVLEDRDERSPDRE